MSREARSDGGEGSERKVISIVPAEEPPSYALDGTTNWSHQGLAIHQVIAAGRHTAQFANANRAGKGLPLDNVPRKCFALWTFENRHLDAKLPGSIVYRVRQLQTTETPGQRRVSILGKTVSVCRVGMRRNPPNRNVLTASANRSR